MPRLKDPAPKQISFLVKPKDKSVKKPKSKSDTKKEIRAAKNMVKHMKEYIKNLREENSVVE